MIVLLPILAAAALNYSQIDGDWVIDVERTVRLTVPPDIEADADRESLRSALKGAKLHFNDGLIQRTMASGELAGPRSYSIRPISDTEFEIAGAQNELFMIVTELTDDTLCVRYVSPASPEEPEKAFALECFSRDDS